MKRSLVRCGLAKIARWAPWVLVGMVGRARAEAPPVAPEAPLLPQPATGSLRLQLVATGFSQPLFATSPRGDRRLFVVEKTGRILIVEDGKIRPEPFLDLSAEIDVMGERGLLGLAFAPDYATTGRFYICYSEARTTNTMIARYAVSPTDPQRADLASRQIILTIPQRPEHTDHKAGWLGFRPGEGPEHLYVAVGDGGGENNPERTAQDLGSLKGKILRLEVGGNLPGCTVPTDNPFVHCESARKEIWAYGLRNPYRPSFDSATGDLYLGDVGQDSEEEVDYEPAGGGGGQNYGWPQREGRHANPAPVGAPAQHLTEPLFSYRQADTPMLRGAVIGGYVYRGHALPELNGRYFFADFPNAAVRSFRKTELGIVEYQDHTKQLNAAGQLFFYSSISSFAEDSDGELLLVDLSGSVFRLVR